MAVSHRILEGINVKILSIHMDQREFSNSIERLSTEHMDHLSSGQIRWYPFKSILLVHIIFLREQLLLFEQILMQNSSLHRRPSNYGPCLHRMDQWTGSFIARRDSTYFSNPLFNYMPVHITVKYGESQAHSSSSLKTQELRWHDSVNVASLSRFKNSGSLEGR